MKRITGILLMFAVLMIACPVFACTGFAVYGGEKPIYGMNFDYPQTELRLTVTENRCQRYFAMEFFDGNGFQPTVGMNDRGLFTSLQMQIPEQTGQNRHTAEELFVHELLSCIRSYGSVEGVLEFVGDRRLVQWNGVTLHALVADAGGGAMIAEAGREQNEFLPIGGDFIVMTNFQNAKFKDKSYKQVYGPGEDRYITAYAYIDENAGDFGLTQAFEALRLTAQDGRSPTLCSMVFDPEERCVYAAIHRDFEKIWKINIPEKSIETYRGFDTDMKFHIPKDGVIVSDLTAENLAAYEVYTEPNPDTGVSNTAEKNMDGSVSVWYWMAAALAAAVLLSIGILVRNRRKSP